MRYALIKGSFHVVGLQPDGDTVRFQPANPQFIDDLGPVGQAPDWRNGRTRINIRFEAIDALETHFSRAHQNTAFGAAARNRMLTLVGFQDVQFNPTSETVTGAVPDSVDGFILAKNLDSYGRVIAFVYAGEIGETDGESVFVDVPRLADSVNARLLDEGLVYPAFYSSLPVDLRNHLVVQTRTARSRQTGLWPQATATVDRPALIPDLAALQELVIWPKLFRRLVSFFRDGNQDLGQLDAWLRQDPRNRDDFVQLPSGELGNMHDIIAVNGQSLRMIYRPEDLVVLPDTFVDEVPTSADLRIIAALVNPTGTDAGQETVTLINASPGPLEMTGWEIRDRQNGAHRLESTLAAGECSRVTLNPSVRLGNSGDDIVLVDPQGREVQRVSYTAADAGREGATLVF